MSPKFPTYDSQRSLTTERPAVFREGSAEEAAAFAPIAETALKITQKWNEAIDSMQETAVKLAYEQAQAQVENDSANDTDINGEDRQIAALRKTSESALKGVTNKALRDRLKFQLDHAQNISAIKIKGIYAKKKIAADNINTEALLQQYATQGLEGDAKAESLIKLKVQQGFYEPKDGEKLLSDTRKLSVQYAISNDPATQEDQSVVLAELRKGGNGEFKNLSPKDRLDLIQDAQRRIFQNNQTFKRESEIVRDGRFNAIFDKQNEGSLTLLDIENEFKIPEELGGIPKKQLLDIKKGIQNKIKSDLEVITENNDKAAEYLTFFDNYISDENDRQKARELLAKAYGDMILSPKEASLLNKIKKETEDISFNNKIVPLRGAVNAIREVLRGRKTATDKDAALAIKKLLSGFGEGKDLVEMVKDILYQDAVKRNPAILNIPKDGQLHIDADGSLKILFPDGTVKDTSSPKTQGE